MVLGLKSKEVVTLKDGSVTAPKGFKAGGVHCGLRRTKLDLGYILSEVPAIAAGVYTTNVFQAAPLQVTQKGIAVEQKLQAVLVNSGNANACTGEQGLQDAYVMQKWFAEKLGIEQHYVAVTSTGVIGVPLPIEKIESGIAQILSPEHEHVTNFEEAILTTDKSVKHHAVQMEIDGKTVQIGGAAKGSGMIHPNMATMLGFITTDANIEYEDLQLALRQVTNHTFNMITVDGDTSTNDMVLAMANGKANNEKLTESHPDWELFIKGLKEVSESLAKQIARDGEGATKLIEVHVKGMKDVSSAQAIGKTIISSNLVKTAIYGTDPNWGRIVCAIGYSGEKVDPEKVSVSLGPIKVVEKGLPCLFSEEEAVHYLQQENIHIEVEMDQGDYEATAWGCDLSYDYVKINASYRT
ncbi:bifunctional ornithine acetyltransferase/N-acetylglutamate synthase [Pseudalkalibacillus decolorationis]|uniref:bifunctional ornithine acetyltransferase/N-acetylglutamate synthase n=1 Tax=Pseudalkalibacillus decolorationis TaxID=163879 RepID=UPI0021479D98|nr:bifunctional ornithine acetyltransferase/N-acetylglutamate synthase [Pseudalkalibacillus decolorationis]